MKQIDEVHRAKLVSLMRDLIKGIDNHAELDANSVRLVVGLAIEEIESLHAIVLQLGQTSDDPTVSSEIKKILSLPGH